MKTSTTIALAGTGLVVALICGGGLVGQQIAHTTQPHTSGSASSLAQAPPKSAPASAASPATVKQNSPAPAPAKSWGDGDWAVPGEVSKGLILVTTVPNDGSTLGCYWEMDRNMNLDFNSIIDNGNLNPGARGRIKVSSQAVQITFNGNCKWTVGK